MPMSDAKRRANDRYISTQDDIKVRVPKGTREEWKAIAAAQGKSLQRYIIDAVERQIAQDSLGEQ